MVSKSIEKDSEEEIYSAVSVQKFYFWYLIQHIFSTKYIHFSSNFEIRELKL